MMYMQRKISWWTTCILILLLSACEKSVDFDLDEVPPKLVVDGQIENGRPPIVVLSKSLNYFSQITPEILQNSFVRNAIIRISDGTRTTTLKEYGVPAGTGVTLYFYSVDTAQPASILIGQFDKTYTIQIQAEGQTYSGQTTIPKLTKTLDSIWWEPAPNNPDSQLVVLMGKFTDPPGRGNYIRYYTSTNDSTFFPGLNSVFDDQIVDGTSYSVEIEKGVDRNTTLDPDRYNFFQRGDTAEVKFTNIDKATFDFWRTMEYSYSSIGNPFASPTTVQGNIKGALGYFGGYAAQYKRLIIPR
jgi:hypothetical protein